MKKRNLLKIAAIVASSVAPMARGATHDGEGAKKEKRTETARHHRHSSATRSSELAGDKPALNERHHERLAGGDDIKNSKHAASYAAAQAALEDVAPVGEDTPVLKLDRSVMAQAEPSFSSIAPSAAPAVLPGDEQSRYPWKREIVTTTFWVGENPTKNNPVPNCSSCWDPHWAKNYGGTDEPDAVGRTPDYIPASFSPGQNPFYVALPYNDMEHGTHKAESAQIIPWFAKAYKGSSKSVCQHRWLAIRFKNRICYAQWEDAGPFRTDHWQYVFGNDRPKPNLNGGAGLDVSPAVRDYLGMNGMDVSDWKFVDFDEVPSGPWAKFGDNNTFVQNIRNAGSQLVETKAHSPVTLRDLGSGSGFTEKFQ